MNLNEQRISKSQYELLAGFRYGLRQFLRFSEESAHAAGLTPQQHQALLAIKGFPGRDQITVGELAERLQILHHSAVGLANRLVAEGHLVRQPGGQDRRQVFVSLTALGEAVLEKVSAAHRQQLRHLGPQINLLLRDLRGESRSSEKGGAV